MGQYEQNYSELQDRVTDTMTEAGCLAMFNLMNSGSISVRIELALIDNETKKIEAAKQIIQYMKEVEIGCSQVLVSVRGLGEISPGRIAKGFAEGPLRVAEERTETLENANRNLKQAFIDLGFSVEEIEKYKV